MNEVRSIDANALKKVITANQYLLSAKNNSIDYGMFTTGIMQAIDNAPTVVNEKLTTERPQGKWIPIKIRELTEEEKEEYPDATFMYDCPLPEDGEEVYITTSSGTTTLDTFYRDDGCYFESYCYAEDVLAWMPKPKPYKKEGEEE